MKTTKFKTGKLVKVIMAGGLFYTTTALSQDIIYTTSQQKIEAKIIEIGKTEVKYRYFDAPDGPIITIEKRKIKSMKIAGKKDNVINVTEDAMSISNNLIKDKTSSLKFHFFSPLTNKLAFDYEWMVKPGFNWEVGAGIIGVGVNTMGSINNSHAAGGYLKVGPKFLLGNSSDIEIEGARYAHPLKGRYFKIEATLNAFSESHDGGVLYDYDHTTGVTTTTQLGRVKNDYLCGSLNLIYGRQYIFGNTITAGWYAGIGYGFESKTSNVDDDAINPNRYSHFYYGNNLPITTTAGFTIGYIHKTPRWIDNIGNSMSSKKASRHSMNVE